MRKSSALSFVLGVGLTVPAGAAGQEAPLQWMVGDFDVKMAIPVNPPGPDYTWVDGIYEGEMSFDGFTLSWRQNSEFRSQPRKSFGIYAWDESAQVYDMSYAEPGSAGVLQLTGTYDAEAKKLVGTGIVTNQFGGELEFELVVEFVSPNRFNQQLFLVQKDGRRTSTAEARYTRSGS